MREKARILVVEDAALERERIADLLEDRYELVFANDGLDGMTAVLGEVPDCILLDLVMPRVSGLEVLRALQVSGSTIPILVVSGHLARAADRVRALMLGASDVLAKPFNALEIRHRVEQLLALPRESVRRPDVADAAELLLAAEEPLHVDEAQFRIRLERAHRFGAAYELPSSLLAVEARTIKAADRLLAAAEEMLRTDDAVLRVGKRAAVFLLGMCPPEHVPVVKARFEKVLDRHHVPLGGLRVVAVDTEQASIAPDWTALLEKAQPWSGAG